jgi:sulfur carrier protein ThiS adenylyltransferase
MDHFLTAQLKNKCVGIAGAGGLGSNCAVALARIGIGKLIISDFDTVCESNLNRQYYFREQLGLPKVNALKENISRITTSTEVEIHNIRLSPPSIIDIFKNCDVIVEAFDLAEMKKMIIETVLHEYPDKYIVSGIGMAGWGNNNMLTTKQFDKLYICGDGTAEVSDTLAPLAPRVGIVANMQANQVLEILMRNI